MALLATTPGAQAGTVTVNFSNYSNTFLSTAGNITFSLAPEYAVRMFGPSPFTIPFVNVFGNPNQIGNSGIGDWPTSNTLTFNFSDPVDDVSLDDYDNNGVERSGGGASFFDAYGSTGSLVSTGFLGDCSPCSTVTIPGTGIKSLVLNNNTGSPAGFGIEGSWLFGVGSVTYTIPEPSTPEPSTWAMMLIGFAGLGFVGYRQTRRAKLQVA